MHGNFYTYDWFSTNETHHLQRLTGRSWAGIPATFQLSKKQGFIKHKWNYKTPTLTFLNDSRLDTTCVRRVRDVMVMRYRGPFICVRKSSEFNVYILKHRINKMQMLKTDWSYSNIICCQKKYIILEMENFLGMCTYISSTRFRFKIPRLFFSTVTLQIQLHTVDRTIWINIIHAVH